MEVLSEEGLGGMGKALELLLNEAMRAERAAFLGAVPNERTTERVGHANGFKPKTVSTRLGKLALAIPQVRALPGREALSWYPQALERGERSERALRLAVAEMYVQGVSTRKVTAVMEQLCGLEVSSAQVSRATAALDAELAAWRERRLPRCTDLILDARYEKMRHGGAVVDFALLLAMGCGRRTGGGSCSGPRCRCPRPRSTGERSSSRCRAGGSS